MPVNEINFLINTALRLINFARKSRMVQGQSKEKLDKAYEMLVEANIALEDEAIRLSDNIDRSL